MKKIIIDAHTHIFSPAVNQNRSDFLSDINFSLLYSSEKAKIAGRQELLEHMERNEIRHSLCLGFSWCDPYICSMENEYILKSAETATTEIIPFGSIPINEKSPLKFIEKLKSNGFAGVGEIGFYASGLTYKNEHFLREVFETCIQTDMGVILHVNEPVGHDYKGKYTTDFTMLTKLISAHPNLRIMLSHWGGGLFIYELMPEIKKKFSKVWYDSAASLFIYDDAVLSAVNISAGKHKAVFGSDFPLIDAGRYYQSFIRDGNEAFYHTNVSEFLGTQITQKYKII